MIGAIVVVVALLGLVIFFSTNKKEKPEKPSAMTPMQNTGLPTPPTEEPKPAAPPAFPKLSAGLKAEATALADQAKEYAKDGERLYKEAGEAKAEGEDDLWQEKLQEAAAYYQEINASWNILIEQIMAEIGENSPYDAEEVANHYFGNAAETIRKAAKRLGAINKDRR
jgi:flagellar biosynthesis/type III secretory pathway protein FliH